MGAIEEPLETVEEREGEEVDGVHRGRGDGEQLVGDVGGRGGRDGATAVEA